MAMKLKILSVIFLSCLLSSGLSAGETQKERSSDSETLEYTLPEILVKGDNSMHSLKLEVIHAEELKFEVFNNLNSTDDFDITCGWHASTGTRIKQWSCDVEYMRKARAEAVSNWIRGYGPMITEHQLAVQYANKTRALNKEMRVLAIQHPELAIAMINAHELQQLYKEEAKKRYKDSIFVGDPPEPELKLNKIDIWAAAFQDHSNGVITDATWERWDSVFKKIFKLSSYRKLWESANRSKYDDEFVSYVSAIIAGG